MPSSPPSVENIKVMGCIPAMAVGYIYHIDQKK
jgi:hypothetical protein